MAVDRIQILAVVLAVIAFGLSYALRPPPKEAMPPAAAEEQVVRPPEPAALPAEPWGDARQDTPMTRATTFDLENDALRVSVSSAAGRVMSVTLVGYPARKGDESKGPVQLVSDADRGAFAVLFGDEALVPLERANWKLERHDRAAIELSSASAGVEVVRLLELDPQGHGAWLRLTIRNRSAQLVKPRLQLVIPADARAGVVPEGIEQFSLFWDQDGSVDRRPVAKLGSPGFWGGLFGSKGAGDESVPAPVEAIGADSQYFLLAALADNARESQALLRPIGPGLGQVALQYGVTELPPGTSVERSWRLYLGPKIPAVVRAVDPRLESMIDVGWQWVRPLVNLFAAALKWLHDHAVGNYGWAIIVITILLRVVTYPLTQRSMQSMKKFGALAPEMKALQEKYGSDRAKLQEETMKLYREKGINPLSSLGGGCIPMLIQMPFMVALYFALQSSIELRHAPFLGWIDDLSAPEDLRLFGLPVRLLPLAMGLSMLVQQRLTPAPSADPQQRQMMYMMSVMFVVLFYGFPSGLVLYWFVSNLLGIAQQLWVNRAPAAAS
jgi:YidC/Oxa1 family membrane protein insertase